MIYQLILYRAPGPNHGFQHWKKIDCFVNRGHLQFGAQQAQTETVPKI